MPAREDRAAVEYRNAPSATDRWTAKPRPFPAEVAGCPFQPYRKRNSLARYIPDFIAVLDNGLQLIMEIKGLYDDDADLKTKAAQRWVQAVNRTGEYGRWDYVVIDDAPKLGPALDGFANASWDGGNFALWGHT